MKKQDLTLLLDDALCGIDERLLAPALEGRRAARAASLAAPHAAPAAHAPAADKGISDADNISTPRKLLWTLPLLTAVAAVVVVIAAIPALTTLVKWALGIGTPPKPPPAGYVTETESAAENVTTADTAPETVIADMPNNDPVTFEVERIRFLADGYMVISDSAPPVYMKGPIVENANGMMVESSHVRVPLIATLRTLGADITNIDEQTTRIVYMDQTWVLILVEKPTLMPITPIDSATVNILVKADIPASYLGLSEDKKEVVVDTTTLCNNILYRMEGNKNNHIVERCENGDRNMLPRGDSPGTPPDTVEFIEKVVMTFTEDGKSRTREFTTPEAIETIVRQFNQTTYSTASDNPAKYDHLTTLEITIHYRDPGDGRYLDFVEKRIIRGDSFLGFCLTDGRISWRDIPPENGDALLQLFRMEE